MLRVISLSTFYLISYVSVARPCRYNASSSLVSGADASVLHSHTAQPQGCADRDPKVQGQVKEKMEATCLL